ncbi:conserved Plasmodium protein, unknown function [Plasmodium gallinaceum]|uniref:Pv-fam-g protein n=1 Tax=Plasmodium gallinaceum TaxID=5849 RepID=A0A1J1GQF8_PLAGA|nr:conserved Plasmodium protein, unknown function [Plasmodium gallinaceum]CRG94743.1 conserved Plasmodium protein, unknown function [Plasmodium gallinaceum]
MDNLYYFMVQNNSVQPIIVRQPSAIIIHSQPKLPITLDLPSQNIILKSDEPQPIIVRQQNPNVIIQKPQNEFYNNPKLAVGLHEKLNEINMHNLNIMDERNNENINALNNSQCIDHVDPSYIYDNHNIAYTNKNIPINNMYFNYTALDNENKYAHYNTMPYSINNAAYINPN